MDGPCLARGFSAALACGLGAVMYPACRRGRKTAGHDGLRGSGSRHCGALERRDDETEYPDPGPDLGAVAAFAPCPIIVRSPPAGGSNGGVAGRWRPPARGVAYVASSGMVMVAVVVAAVGNAPALSTADQAAAVLRGCQVSPETRIAQAMRAVLAACASTATFTGRRARMPRCHSVARSVRQRALRMMVLAPSANSLRSRMSPWRLMPWPRLLRRSNVRVE